MNSEEKNIAECMVEVTESGADFGTGSRETLMDLAEILKSF